MTTHEHPRGSLGRRSRPARRFLRAHEGAKTVTALGMACLLAACQQQTEAPLAAAGGGASNTQLKPLPGRESSAPKITRSSRVRMQTTAGDVVIEVYAEAAPNAAARFLELVRAGEVIAVLESRDLEAQRAEAVAALNEARANERSLVTGTIPKTNAEDQKALNDARAKVNNARATYERRRELYDKGGISNVQVFYDADTTKIAKSDLRKRLDKAVKLFTGADGKAAGYTVSLAESNPGAVTATFKR